MSAPRTRGCSWLSEVWADIVSVGPADAGMFRRTRCPRAGRSRRPRGRGDVPAASRPRCHPMSSAPRTRGCSSRSTNSRGLPSVGPADAGMFRSRSWRRSSASRRPRGRGDVPHEHPDLPARRASAPRTRGCSGPGQPHRAAHRVGPADAGMFHLVEVYGGRIVQSAPRTRGCSDGAGRRAGRGLVGPADAGMFRACSARTARPARRPRGRGDVPPRSRR